MTTGPNGQSKGAMTRHIPTSEVLRGLLDEAPADCVTLGWLLEKLHKRSFGIVLLLAALSHQRW